MKKFFKNNNWREALPIFYNVLRVSVLYEIIKLVESSEKSVLFKIIISILIICLEFQWFISQTNKNE
jgi:hypothetical protein